MPEDQKVGIILTTILGIIGALGGMLAHPEQTDDTAHFAPYPLYGFPLSGCLAG